MTRFDYFLLFDYLTEPKLTENQNWHVLLSYVNVFHSETDESIDVDIRQKEETPTDYQDVAYAVPDPVPVPAQPEYEAEIQVFAEPAYGSRITQRLPEGTHSGFIKNSSV